MEKVVLSKGYEFPLVANGIRTDRDGIRITFVRGEYSVEQLAQIWEGNAKIQVKIDENSIQTFTNYMKCDQITLVKNYLIDTEFKCPECGVEVEPSATTCAACNAAFESPAVEEIRADVCTVNLSVPDINDRMADAENAIEDIIDTILG